MPSHVTQRTHGGPDVLEIVDVPRPTPAAGEILVRVAAAALNPVDGKTRAGKAIGLPLPLSVGWDFAGTVEQLGEGVDGFAVGDRVFGMPSFPAEVGYGQYVAAPAEHWAPSPRSLDDVHAAAVPLAALTSLQAFRRVADLQPGQRVLVHAAGGGVGHLAVQIAKILGAEVVATASADKEAFVKELGADEVVDYRAVDFAQVLAERPVDVVLDLIGGDNAVRSVAATKPGGLVIAIPSGVDDGLEAAATAAGVRAGGWLVQPDGDGLRELAAWIDEGRLAVTVSQTYDLADVRQAHVALDTGRTLGKIVLTVP